MTFKADVLAAAKLKAEELEDWKFVTKRYRSRPAEFCDLLIDPSWNFCGSPAWVTTQPDAGVYIKEVEDILSHLSGFSLSRTPTFSRRIRIADLKYPFDQTVYAEDFESREKAIAKVMRDLDNIIEFGEAYLRKQYCLDSKESFYLSVPEETRGIWATYYCIVRGLLGDTDYIKRVLRKEIDPEGHQELELIGKVLDYFS
ncbi:hypothetical protein MJO52_06950 [Microbulbifer variabilis]|uniref:Uncharacterized protein n=1 Tax=Microbulbifer variabilis TaxID=266805 RepID=A0ABY4VEZ6_9GAMM|nr:hypothetical protein [Microbulbifer variabilis]USD22871.1 hypothetical protein MJO52_06950 [Microbulbifer variabilis]